MYIIDVLKILRLFKISDGIGVQEAIFLPSTLFVQNLGWSEVTSRIIGLKD